MAPRARVAIATVVAVLAGHFTYMTMPARSLPPDFGQLWYGARVVIAGGNPYEAIGPGREYRQRWPLYYPLPSVVAVSPVAMLPYRPAMACVAALGLFALAWALMRGGFAPLVGLASVGAWKALYLVQWSPILTGGLALAPLSVLWIGKPTIGLACFIARPTRWAIWGGVLFVTLAFVFDPAWPAAWLAALSSSNVEPGFRAHHFAAIQFPGGFLVLAALARWRRWEARLLVALACVPQTMLFYETVPLLLIPRGWKESIAFTGLTWCAVWWTADQGPLTFAAATPVIGAAITLSLYLPCMLMVLRRPNEGRVPAWLEYRITRWPAWLRGTRSGAG